MQVNKTLRLSIFLPKLAAVFGIKGDSPIEVSLPGRENRLLYAGISKFVY
jgi:hypothetical protein